MAEKYIARSSDIAARMIGGEMMIMSPIDSTFFTLNEVATVIWQAADGKTPLAEIIDDKICPIFDVSSDQAKEDSESFVEELSKHGILLVSDQPIESSSRQEPAR